MQRIKKSPRLLQRWIPDYYVKSIGDIDYEALWKAGIRTLLFDNDNTILTYDTLEISEETQRLFAWLKERGFALWIISNGRKARVKALTASLQVHGIAKAGKPLTRGARYILRETESEPASCAIIGDQVFTDVWCGNECGMTSVWVHPISLEIDEAITRVKRPLERVLLAILRISPSEWDNAEEAPWKRF